MDITRPILEAVILKGVGSGVAVPPERFAQVLARVEETCAVRGLTRKESRAVARLAGWRVGAEIRRREDARPRVEAVLAARAARKAAEAKASEELAARRAAALVEFNRVLGEYRQGLAKTGRPWTSVAFARNVAAGAEAVRAILVLGNQEGVALRHGMAENTLEQAKSRLLKRMAAVGLSEGCVQLCKCHLGGPRARR